MPYYIAGFKNYFEVTVLESLYSYHKSQKIFHISVYHRSVKKKWHYTQIVHITFTRNRKNRLFLFLWMRHVIQVTTVDCNTSIYSREKENFGDTQNTSSTPVLNTGINRVLWKVSNYISSVQIEKHISSSTDTMKLNIW